MNLTNPILLFGLCISSFSVVILNAQRFFTGSRLEPKLVRIEYDFRGTEREEMMEWNGIEYKNAVFTRVNKLSAF